jgi:formyltetrahydrofolate hydrolase
MHKSDSKASINTTASKDTMKDSKANRKQSTINKSKFGHAFNEILLKEEKNQLDKDVKKLKVSVKQTNDFLSEIRDE